MSLKPAPRGVLNPVAGQSHFHHSRPPSDPDLAHVVDRHWIVTWDLRDRPPYDAETLPFPNVHMAIEAGRSAVHGVSTRRFVRHLEGKGRVVGTKFRPGGFFPFVGFPIANLRERVVPLSDLFGAEGAQLADDVLRAGDEVEQCALVSAFLRRRLPPRDDNTERAAQVVGLAEADPSICSVADLSARAGISPRALQRLFERYVGVSPKWTIRRFRIHEAVDRVSRGTDVDWAAMAVELGYFDQAHFVNDFTAQVGRSPATYAALCAAAAESG
jgi:AraC-like DNA-binding protein